MVPLQIFITNPSGFSKWHQNSPMFFWASLFLSFSVETQPPQTFKLTF